jgi:RimJ/RimL family protein N-acetyltransferase
MDPATGYRTQRALAVEPRTLRTARLVLKPRRRAAPRDAAGAEQPWGENPIWAIEIGAAIVGTIHLTVDGGNQIAELGYDVEPANRNRGIATEAARATIDWGFRVLNLAKIYARTDAWNEASWRVMENAGLRREAVLRSHHAHNGDRTDEMWYGILRTEWADAGERLEPLQEP